MRRCALNPHSSVQEKAEKKKKKYVQHFRKMMKPTWSNEESLHLLKPISWEAVVIITLVLSAVCCLCWGPWTGGWSCPLESISRPPSVMIDDKLLRGGKRVPWWHMMAAYLQYERKLVDKTLQEFVQELMWREVTWVLLRSALNYTEVCAVTDSEIPLVPFV